MDIVLILILLILAAISNACMDLINFRYSISIFNKWKIFKGKKFWKMSNDFWNGWHLFKGITLFSAGTAFILGYVQKPEVTAWYWMLAFLLCLSIIWGIAFEVVYEFGTIRDKIKKDV